MDFLGPQGDQLRKMKSQLMAQEALLKAIVQSSCGATKELLASNFQIQAEQVLSECLNSMATDSLNDELRAHLKGLEEIFQPQSDSSISKSPC